MHITYDAQGAVDVVRAILSGGVPVIQEAPKKETKTLLERMLEEKSKK